MLLLSGLLLIIVACWEYYGTKITKNVIKIKHKRFKIIIKIIILALLVCEVIFSTFKSIKIVNLKLVNLKYFI